MKTKTNVKAGVAWIHHNQITSGIAVKTRVKSGIAGTNHNQTCVSEPRG